PGATPRRTLRPPMPSEGSEPSAAVDSDMLRQSSTETEWTVRYPGDLGGTAESGLYQGLLNVSSQPVRVQKLGYLLHWDRNLPTDSGDPLSLAACLRGVAPQNRMAAIQAFWRVRERAAALQLLNEQAQQLGTLKSIAIGLRDSTGMAEAAVRLQA